MNLKIRLVHLLILLLAELRWRSGVWLAHLSDKKAALIHERARRNQKAAITLEGKRTFHDRYN